MQTMVGLDRLTPSPGGSVVTVGTFDGLHVGHRALIAATTRMAGERDLSATVITWDRHPNATLRPERVPPLLTSPERKFELIADMGPDVLVVLPFDEELSRWPPERFVDRVLVAGLSAKSVIVGAGWRFGHRAAGDVGLLTQLGRTRGFEVTAMELVEVDGEPVSSSRVRSAVEDGDMPLAARLLGRPFDVQGIVSHGAHRGKGLGYPTANLSLPSGLLYPRTGVYAGEAHIRDHGPHAAAVNVGVNPTFGGGAENPVGVEAFLLDFDGDLYGETLRVGFLRRLRDELRFASVDDLVAQMARDVEETRALTC
jgi:riboflavin kinase / FMN adenylyltransferase